MIRMKQRTEVNEETFKPGMSLSSLFRSNLFGKTGGEVSDSEKGGAGLLVRCSSPISGTTLIFPRPATSSSSSGFRLKDPLSGSLLMVQGGKAILSVPLQKQPMTRSRSLFLKSDVENTILTLRSTTTLRGLNEKIGTSGSPTGRNDPMFTR